MYEEILTKIEKECALRNIIKRRFKVADRSELINQLAVSMGVADYTSTNYKGSRYDAKTGTLFCNGMAISSSVADMAVKHFSLMERKCDMQDSAARQMAMIYRCAIESIKMMQNPKIKEMLIKEAEGNTSKAV